MKKKLNDNNIIEKIFAASNQGIIIQDESGFCIYANKMVYLLMDNINGKSGKGTIISFDLFDEDNHAIPAAFLPFQQIIAGNKTAELSGKLINKKSKKEQWCTIRSMAYTNEDKTYVLTSFYPIQPPVSGPHKEDMVSFVGHELKSYITNIKAYAQLLHRRLQKAGDTQNGIYLEKLDYQADKLTKLISDLADTQRIILGRIRLRKDIVDVSSLIQNIISQLKEQYNNRVIISTGQDNLYTQGDKNRLENAFYHILKNALFYSEDDAEVFVTTKRNKKEIIVRIVDKGRGMDDEELDHVFTPFFKGQMGVSGDRKLGIGAFLSRGIIQAHDGDLTITSEKKIGTTVTVVLPIKTYE